MQRKEGTLHTYDMIRGARLHKAHLPFDIAFIETTPCGTMKVLVSLRMYNSNITLNHNHFVFDVYSMCI